MAEQMKLEAKARAAVGSRAVRRLRREGWLPGVVIGEEAGGRPIQLNTHDFETMLREHTGENLILDLVTEGAKPHKVLLKAVQHHPVSGRLLHADFEEISMRKKLRVQVAVELVGEPVGVERDGGVLDQQLRTVEIECLPGDLVEKLELDVSGMNIGDSVHAADLSVGEKLALLTASDVTIASVLAPRVEEEPEVPEEEAAEGEEAAAEEGAEPSEKGEAEPSEEAAKKAEGAGKES